MSPYNLEESVTASRAVAVAAGRSAEWAEYVVTSDLFAGDFGDGSERTLADHLTIAKRGGRCHGCAQTDLAAPIVKGEIVRVIKMVDSEGFYGGRVCVRCLDRDYAEGNPSDDDLEDDEAPS
jgi:hypothetical protein